MNDAETILKPCPFCGGEYIGIQMGVAFNVKCHDCHCKIPAFMSREEAESAWNTRTVTENEH